MNEARRQFALGVAGVRVWYARMPLPGAAPSPDFEFDEPERSEPTADPVPQAAAIRPAPRRGSEASREGLARLQGLLADASDGAAKSRDKPVPDSIRAAPPADTGQPATPVSPRAPAPDTGPLDEPAGEPEPGPVAAGSLAGQAVGFHWRFWVGGQWLLVSNCPDAASRALEDRLAGNIFAALGDSVLRIEAIKWPVFNNPAVPGNDAAGAADVVAGLAAGMTAPMQLWLGIEPDGADPEAEAVWREVRAPLGAATVSFPGSLAALSSEPASKRALWQALRRHLPSGHRSRQEEG